VCYDRLGDLRLTDAIQPRNLLYTGLTRGKQLVVLVGQRKALAIAVRNQGGGRR
jgi:exodeoxyribonuclease V alpha subunit